MLKNHLVSGYYVKASLIIDTYFSSLSVKDDRLYIWRSSKGCHTMIMIECWLDFEF